MATLGDYHRLSAALRKRGFKEDTGPDAPICRWIAKNVVLDVMPTKPEILGFGNEWYQPALNAATRVALPSGVSIRMVTAPYFLATKFGAFDGRGKGDYVMSHDMEDIVAVLDGRQEVASEVRQVESGLRSFLAGRFARLLHDASFVHALPGHLPGDAASQARAPLILERMREMASASE